LASLAAFSAAAAALAALDPYTVTGASIFPLPAFGGANDVPFTGIFEPFLGGELPGESFFFCFMSFLALRSSSRDKFGVGSGMIVGRGCIGFKLIADGPRFPMPPAMSCGPVAGTIGRALLGGRMGLIDDATGLL
jgi:hypothetical protein